MRGRPILLSLLLVATACAAPAEAPSTDEESAAGQISPGSVQIARSGGGTDPLPIDDGAALDQLQGLGVTPAPSIMLSVPSADATLEEGKLDVSYRIANYEVGEAEDLRQHVHVILDDHPYEADYSSSGSTSFGSDRLTPGSHLLTVFLSRASHLSLKNPEASDHVVFHVREPGAEGGFDTTMPTLVYSRPKGEYARSDGSARNIMLDFYLLNATLGPDAYKVRATIDGGPAMMIEEWGPRIILTDPAAGEHTVRLELLDAEGYPVPGPINDTTRTITIIE